jgi:hypothetical protein
MVVRLEPSDRQDKLLGCAQLIARISCLQNVKRNAEKSGICSGIEKWKLWFFY